MTTGPQVDLDALLCALILAPNVFSRNRFFRLFENRDRAKVRRRAARVRGILAQLNSNRAHIVAEAELEDGQVLIRYHMPELGFTRSTALSQLEAACLRYARNRADKTRPLSAEDRELVMDAMRRLGQSLGLPQDEIPGEGTLS